MDLLALYIIFSIPIIYAIYKAMHDTLEDKMNREIRKLTFDFFYENGERPKYHELLHIERTSLMTIKAICGHQGVQVEIDGSYIKPSLDFVRSLSFMKDSLPEIEEQVSIANEANYEWSVLVGKFDHVDRTLSNLPLLKWIRLDDIQKKEMIQNLSEEYDRTHLKWNQLDKDDRDNYRKL